MIDKVALEKAVGKLVAAEALYSMQLHTKDHHQHWEARFEKIYQARKEWLNFLEKLDD